MLTEHITLGRLQGGGKRSKQEIADYILMYKNHKLAVIEAKAWDKPYTEGVAQAKTYAQKLNSRFPMLPTASVFMVLTCTQAKRLMLRVTLAHINQVQMQACKRLIVFSAVM